MRVLITRQHCAPRLGGQEPKERERHPGQCEAEQQSGEKAPDDVCHRQPDPGSNARRTPSPTSVRQSTVRAIATAGKVVVHAEITSPSSRFGRSMTKKCPQFVASMFPQLAFGSGIPKVRNDSADSSTMFAAAMIARYTATGPTRCGRRCL